MIRQCEICGSPIEMGAGVCVTCGMNYAGVGEPDRTSYSNPRWGKVLIDQSRLPSVEREKTYLCAKETWRALEVNTSQKLFPGQFSKLSFLSDQFELYGPYSSYLELEKRLGISDGSPVLLTFSDLAADEIHRIRDAS